MAPLAPISEYSQAQQEQVNVLESIYGENFQRVQGQKSAWQKRHNLAFEIRLDALNDKDLSVLLQIELPPEWPKVAPSFKLKEADNVRPHVSDKIRGLLKTVQPDNDIYTICADMQEVMEDAAESKIRRKTMPALDEERARKETDALRKAEAEKARRAKEDQEQQARAAATLAKKVESLQLRSERVNGRASSERDAQPSRTLTLPNPLVQFDEIMSIADKKGDLTHFQDVWGTYVILKTKEKKVTVVTPVVENAVTARRLLLKQIHLDAGIFSHPSRLLDEVRDVEKLLQELKKRPFESVVDVFGYKVVVNHEAEDQELITSIDLTILSAYANKGSLAEMLDIYDCLSGSRIMSWSTQLLEALAFFDVLGHAHPAVHLNNILLFRADNGHISVQLSDGYGTDLRTLVMQARSAIGIKEPSIPAGWRAPELNQTEPARSNKTCLWDLGVVIMQMISGKKVLSEYTSPSDYLSANNLTDELYDMLFQMCALDQSQRSNAYDLTSAEFLRGDGTLFMSASPMGPATPYFAGRRESAMEHKDSPWKSNWEEIDELGKGGFGQVVKARNRIDMMYYAVKKVRCESDEDMSEFLREIKLLSGLKSSRIVRYYSSWVESDNAPVMDSEATSDFATSQSIPELPSTGNEWVDGADYLSAPGPSIRFQDSSPIGDSRPGFFRRAGEIESDSDSDCGVGAAALHGQQTHIQRQAMRPAGPKTLYIAMELCETQSLRTIIKNNTLKDIDEIWRIFGQIVEGLAYIHGRGLIHRDLKPENIFLDAENDIRIGDFGLATRGKVESIAGKSAMNQATEESRSLGTASYVAPELKSDGKGAYTSKVDMYSLGVTFLEMCCPVKTSTGRYEMLANARKSRRDLPSRLWTTGWDAQRKLIFSLLSHVQEERPSATDIIASGVIPQPVGSEQIHRYVMSLTRGNPESFGELVKHFFAMHITPAQDQAWDSGVNDINPARDVAVSSTVNQKLQAIFQRHGAVDGKRQDIFPLSSLYAKPATFLDKSGITLQLLYDMTLPFARLLARNKIDHTRHYAFGVVYREGNVGGRPFPFSEVSFDIVSYSAKELSIKDAEVFKVLDEILTDFPSLKQSKSIIILLNHSELLDMLLRFCGIEGKHWDAVKNVLSTITAGTGSWKRIEAELRGPKFNLPRASIQQLAQFNFQDDLQSARKRLQKGLTNPSDIAKIQQMFTRLLEIQQYAENLKVETKIFMNPLVNYSEPLYRGSIMFQCVDVVQKKILAVGGRYDHLIQSFGPGISFRGAPRAVGLRFNSTELAERLAADMTAVSKASRQTQKPQRCDVLITSFDENTLKTICLAVAAELWTNDIRAELTDLHSSFEELAAAYKNDGHCLVVSVRQDSNAIGGFGIRVRALGRQDEEEVKSTELVTWLKDELKDKQASDAEPFRAKLRREASAGESSAQISVDARPADVIVIQPKHKGKKTNRQHLVDDAGLVVREEARSMIVEAPVLVIEATNEVLEYMRATRMDSPESWKTFFQACPAEETRYLKDVQQTLQEMADNGKHGAWIYGSKTRACIYYDFGKSLISPLKDFVTFT